MRKSTIFIICLLCIVLGELYMLFKSSTSSQTEEYALDTKVYDMPVREVESKVVKPFLFEMHSADSVDVILDEFAADITESMADNNLKPLFEQKIEEAKPEEILIIKDEELSEPIVEVSEEKPEEEAVIIEEQKPESLLPAEESVEERSEASEETPQEPTAAEEPVIEPEQPVVTPVAENKVPEKRAKIAIVIDDLGLSVPFTKQIAQVKAPLTVSFLPYGASDKTQVNMLKDAGFEVMLHVPMMPHVPAALAPVTLSPEMDKAETQAELNKMLNRFEGTGMRGINNHMGSLLTERVKNMGYVMEVLKKRGMYFLDSKTTGKSAAGKAAKEYGVAYIARDVFLDNKNEYNYIMGQFRQAEKVAEKNGQAVAIGHPYSQTLKVLQDWLKEADEKGFEVVHLSDLLPNE